MGNKIFERYILKDFFKTLILSLSGIVFIYLITDFFERIGYYIDRKVSSIKLIVYYIYHIPYVLSLTIPLGFLLGVYFSLGRMTKNNEILAMRGIGVSSWGIYKPVFLYTFLLSLTMMAFNSTVLPYSLKERNEWWREEILKIKSGRMVYQRNVHILTGSGWYLYAKNLSNNRMKDIDLVYLKNGKIDKRIYAKWAVYNDSVWILNNVFLRDFSTGKEHFLKKRAMPFKELKEKPQEIARMRGKPQFMGNLQLIRYINRLVRSGNKTGREKLELYLRFSYPMICFILVLYGCPLALEVKRRGLAFGLGWGLFLSFFFWGIVQFFRVIGQKEIIFPHLAAIIPDAIFLFVGLYFMLSRRD